MDSFIELIDTYLSNYSIYDKGKVNFECDYGELIFFKDTSNIITLFGIYIHPDYRKQGICRNILCYLIDKSKNKFESLCVQSVLSKILYEYLLRFKYENKNFKLKKTGFYYKL